VCVSFCFFTCSLALLFLAGNLPPASAGLIDDFAAAAAADAFSSLLGNN
jgi:hypothetical protein